MTEVLHFESDILNGLIHVKSNNLGNYFPCYAA